MEAGSLTTISIAPSVPAVCRSRRIVSTQCGSHVRRNRAPPFAKWMPGLHTTAQTCRLTTELLTGGTYGEKLMMVFVGWPRKSQLTTQLG